MTASPNRILVRLPNWLGDALLARPLLHALAATPGGVAVTAIGPRELLELLEPDRTWERAEPLPCVPGLLNRLRSSRIDAALVLPPSFSSAWLAFRAGARQRIGYAHEGRSLLLTHALRRRPRGELHLSREYLALGAVLGAREVDIPALPVSEATQAEARLLLERAGIAGESFAVLAPGATFGPAKRWPEERFMALGRRLALRGFVVLACGSGSEREICERIAKTAGVKARSVAGETTLPVMAALCARAALVVCNDSGLGHLAAATGAPTVAIFGSTSSAWTAPIGARVRVVQRPPVCSPCFQRECRIGYGCLTAVEVADVERAALEVAA